MNPVELLTQLCSVPAAPFVEQRVYEWVAEFCAKRRKLRVKTDRWGNRLIELVTNTSKPRLVLVAHTDHPGLVARRMINARTVEADFRGGVLTEYVQGAAVRFFNAGSEVTGRVIATASSTDRPSYPTHVEVRVNAAVEPGAAGMFDQGVGRVKGDRFLSRVCDDLAGAASALAALDALHQQKSPPNVAVLLTRAEEEGFIGAIATAMDRSLLRKTDRIISIECSAEQPYAKQGDGVVIRVGDRTSIFNSPFTFFINQQAERLAKDDPKFRFQRCLMPGGSCEGTVFDAFGYCTAAICVPLGNYHNMDRTKKRIGPEFVHLDDWHNMVKLFLRLSEQHATFTGDHAALRARVVKRFENLKHLLKPQLKPGRNRSRRKGGSA